MIVMAWERERGRGREKSNTFAIYNDKFYRNNRNILHNMIAPYCSINGIQYTVEPL